MKNIFLKINKKALMIIGFILIIAMIASFLIYKYSKDIEKVGQNKTEEVKIEAPSEQIMVPNENQQNQNQPKETLIVCVEKCGDGICQPAGTICTDKLNCTCAETKADCPQDCK